jgi:hypothetical protein
MVEKKNYYKVLKSENSTNTGVMAAYVFDLLKQLLLDKSKVFEFDLALDLTVLSPLLEYGPCCLSLEGTEEPVNSTYPWDKIKSSAICRDVLYRGTNYRKM